MRENQLYVGELGAYLLQRVYATCCRECSQFTCSTAQTERAQFLNAGESIIYVEVLATYLLQRVLAAYLFHCTNRESEIFKCGRIDYHRQIGLLAVVLHRQRERAKINKYCKFDCQIYLWQEIATRDKIFFRDLTLNQNMAYHFDQFFFCYLLNNWPHDFTSPAD